MVLFSLSLSLSLSIYIYIYLSNLASLPCQPRFVTHTHTFKNLSVFLQKGRFRIIASDVKCLLFSAYCLRVQQG